MSIIRVDNVTKEVPPRYYHRARNILLMSETRGGFFDVVGFTF